MSRKSSTEQAIELLTEALERLDQLRNAQPRDSAFKQWRQSTLTTLQRLWKDDPTKAERFRRVPFSPISSKASERATRDAHDAGCREARKLLKMWIDEIGHDGLSASSSSAVPGKIPQAEVSEETSQAEDVIPFEQMPRAEKVAPIGKMAPIEKMTPIEKMIPIEKMAPIEQVVPIEKTSQAEKPAPVEKPKKPAMRTKKQTLKSMLDLDNLPESDDGLDLSVQENPAQPMPDAAPVARAISALVYELPRLNVPEENRDFLRGALLDIANRIEFDELKWTTLQELVFLAMQHPSIGRRILPLIVPYLDKAA